MANKNKATLHSKKDASVKQSRKKRNDKSIFQSRTKLISISFGVFISTMIAIFALLIAIEYKYIFVPDLKASKILSMEKTTIESMLKILDGKLDQINPAYRKKHDEAFTKSIKNGLLVIQERVSSLQTQTSQYEKISTKIPGGPKSFIETSVKEIESLQMQMLVLDKKALAILDPTSDHPLDTWEQDNIYSLSHFVLPKTEIFSSDPRQQRVIMEHGIELWPESWTTEEAQDMSVAQKNYDDAINSNVSLEEVFTSLSHAAKALGQLSELFVKYEDMQEQTQLLHENTMFPSLLANSLYKAGIGSWARTPYFEILQEVIKQNKEILEANLAMMQDTDSFEKLLDSGNLKQTVEMKFIEACAAQYKVIMEEYKRNEEVLKQVMPMKYIFVDRAKTFVNKVVELRNAQKQDESGHFIAYVKLKNDMFAELGRLKERIISLGK